MNSLFTKQSQIGYLIKITGVVVMVWGVIQGIFSLVIMMEEMQYGIGLTGTTFFALLSIIATHVLYGLLIIGFGEVIDMLQKIYFHMDPKAKKQWEKEQREKKEALTSNGEVPFWVDQEVKRYYEKMKSNVQSIEKTSDAYVFKITVDERVEYMEVGNFEPRILSDEEVAKFIE